MHEPTLDLRDRPALPPATPPEFPNAPGYEVLGEIGRGGMGVVYAAREIALGREVALKTLLPGAHASRFLVESRLTARLPHPNIPPVYALGAAADGSPFLAMKLVRGRTLADLLRGRPSPADGLGEFVRIFEQVALAVGFAHSRAVVHRDLKPANVMVGEFGEVQVMDWGLAKDLDAADDPTGDYPVLFADSPDLTRAGTVLGTPGYMAPEQARGEAVDARADVFALGSLLTLLLTDQPAFTGGSVRDAIARAAAADLANARARLAACKADADLVRLARHCLSADPADRPADGRAVAAAVDAYRRGVEARLRRAEAKAAGRRLRRLATASVMAALLAGIVGTSVGLFRASRARDDAVESAEKERLATRSAERRLSQVEKGVEAFAGLLSDLDPRAEEEAGEPPLAQIRRRAVALADELDGDRIGDPQVVARLQLLLGRTLTRLGEGRKAVEVLTRALAVRERELGPEHPDTIAALSHLAGAYRAAGDMPRQLEFAKRALFARDKAVPRNDSAVLVALIGVADANLAAGDAREAVAVYEAVRGILAKNKIQLDSASMRANLARAYLDAGDAPRAVRLMEDLRATLERGGSPDHPDLLGLLQNLAAAYTRVGRADEAVKILESVRDRALAKFGPASPYALLTQASLAEALRVAKRPKEALAVLEKIRDPLTARLGASHARTIAMRTSLDRVYLDLARSADAAGKAAEAKAWRAERAKLGK